MSDTDNGALAAPSRMMVGPIEDILMHAISEKTDPANLEKLVTLWERVNANRAERAFNDAMQQFKSKCPAIIKNRQAIDDRGNARKVMYVFADLSQITSIVDPVLSECGLSYKFGMSISEKQITTTCTVKHIDGHKDTAEFTCPACGTSIMNDAQKAASATSYGRRYSLQFALGITTDTDDDGRGMKPNPTPEHDASAPKVGTRDERKAEPVTKVTGKILGEMSRAFAAAGLGNGVPEFVAWVAKTLNINPNLDLTACANWTPDMVKAVRAAIKEGGVK